MVDEVRPKTKKKLTAHCFTFQLQGQTIEEAKESLRKIGPAPKPPRRRAAPRPETLRSASTGDASPDASLLVAVEPESGSVDGSVSSSAHQSLYPSVYPTIILSM